jgi:anaphase-promoting complex subunit 3
MFIEEDPNTPTPYSPTSLEHQLIEGIMDSFHNHLTGNASFLGISNIHSIAERLLCEHDTEEFRSLLAECYLKENKPHKVCHLLKDCKTDYARFC